MTATSLAKAPLDLATANPTGPRAKTLTWTVGDVVQTGSTRWIIRTLTGDRVELEAANVNAGIWWHTTLGNLPEKAVA